MRRLVLSLLALGVHMDVAPNPAHAADWNPLAPLAQARHGAAAAELGGRVYVLGGRGIGDLANTSVWDPGTTGWSEAAAMSQPRFQCGAAALGGFVYLLGGHDAYGWPSINVECFDPGANAWSSRSGLPTSRAGMATAAVGGSLVVAGGVSDEGMLGTDCYRYDPVADWWSVIGALSLPRAGVAAAVLGDRMWVMGGSDGIPRARVDVYDATSGGWSVGPDLPEPLQDATAASFGGRVWIMGGLDATQAPSARVYSAGADGVWQPESALPAASAGGFAVATSTDCMMVGGGLDGAGQPMASVWSRCNLPPPPPPSDEVLAVGVTLSPASLNAGSQGNWITTHVETDGWPASDIVVESLRLDGVAPEAGSAVADGGTLTVKFPRAPFAGRPDGEYLLALTGERSDGVTFAGTASLSVHGNGNGPGSRPRSAQPHELRVVHTAFMRGAIAFSLAQPAEVAVDVLDPQGRTVARLARETLPAGDHLREWPAGGQRVSSGIYLVRLRASGAQAMVRLALLR